MIENSYKMSNFFLESINSNKKDKISINDITRIAYRNNEEDSDIKLNKGMNPMIHYKENFKERNDRINSLNEEILILKNKLKIIDRKDEEINELKIKNKELIHELELLNKKMNEMIELKLENNQLKEDKNKIQNQMNELKKSNKKEKGEENKIKININEFKEILKNRLKSSHENHINELIHKYDLDHKKEIDKSLMEQILFKAIHL